MATDYSAWLLPVAAGIGTYAVLRYTGKRWGRRWAGALGLTAGVAAYAFTASRAAAAATKRAQESAATAATLNAAAQEIETRL